MYTWNMHIHVHIIEMSKHLFNCWQHSETDLNLAQITKICSRKSAEILMCILWPHIQENVAKQDRKMFLRTAITSIYIYIIYI